MSKGKVTSIEKEAEAHKYDEWAIKDALSTLKRAEEIKSDPKMMKLLQPHMKQEIRSLKALKQHIQDKSMMESEMDME